MLTFKDNKIMRCGYTTGACAAAATKAAAIMIFRQEKISTVKLMTPKQIELDLEVHEPRINSNMAVCAIKKDSGDDPDVTNGIMVYSKVTIFPDKSGEKINIHTDGGTGVGRVTKKGLQQPIGSAAINEVPRKMIESEAKNICEEYGFKGDVYIEISIPEGVEIAKRTFNPRLGIEGGISVLGTSGIVEPMSEKALTDSIRVEISVKSAYSKSSLLVTLGNYGENFTENQLNIDLKDGIKCSNYIGETIDYALEFNIKNMLFVGHIGKMIKVAGGIMNTHSRFADARMDILTSCAIKAGASLEGAKQILNCITTDEAVEILIKENILDKTMEIVVNNIEYYMRKRAYDKINFGIIIFSNVYGLLGKNNPADEMKKDMIKRN